MTVARIILLAVAVPCVSLILLAGYLDWRGTRRCGNCGHIRYHHDGRCAPKASGFTFQCEHGCPGWEGHVEESRREDPVLESREISADSEEAEALRRSRQQARQGRVHWYQDADFVRRMTEAASQPAEPLDGDE